MSGGAGLRQAIYERDTARQKVAALERELAAVQEQMRILEYQARRLRALGTPGEVVRTLDMMRETASAARDRAEDEVTFWGVVEDWAQKMGTSEREEWGDLLPPELRAG